MRVLLLTQNPQKLPEYQQLFSRYHIQVEQREHNPARVLEYLAEPKVKLLIKDESNLYLQDGSPAGAADQGQVLNICRLQTWWLDPEKGLQERVYIATVEGILDGSRYQPSSPDVFGWDQAFTPSQLTLSYDEQQKLALKTSARSQALSALTRDFFWFPKPKQLSWFEVPSTEAVDFQASVSRFVASNPYLQKPELKIYGLDRLIRASLQGGVHFRASPSRRIGNYWLPGLNGGIPFTPKDDPIHEITYFFHDLMHYLVPDLLFDGSTSRPARLVYLASRMISESISLVLADMLFVDSLKQAGVSYDFPKRRIHPLFKSFQEPATTPESLKKLCWRMTRYCLLGESVLGEGPEAEAFITKYKGFFVADWAWTAANWSNMARRAPSIRDWLERLGGYSGVETAGAVALKLKIEPDASFLEVVRSCFDYLFEARIVAALQNDAPLNEPLAYSNAFRRWLAGQLAVFPRYQAIVGWPELAERLFSRAQNPALFTAGEIREIRQEYAGHLNQLARKAALSFDDARSFAQVFPLFDPFFVFYDRASSESIEDAWRKAVAAAA